MTLDFVRVSPEMSAIVGGAAAPVRQPDVARLYAIVYISTAARLLSMDELEHLCSRAQARNLQEDVTGVLLYSDGAFMQYLEGPAAGLSRVYGFIKADPLHYGVIDLLREPITEREFASWSMELRAIGAHGHSDVSQQDALLTARPASLALPRSKARELLLNFWSRGRYSVASTLLDFSEERARRMGHMLAA